MTVAVRMNACMKCQIQDETVLMEASCPHFTEPSPPGSTSALAAWLRRHDGHVIAHNVRGFRCMDEPDGHPDRTFLVAAAWNEADTSVDGDIQRQNALLHQTVQQNLRAIESERSRAERAERRCEELSAEVKDRWTERERLAAKCAELSVENEELKRENERLRGDIAVNLRRTLANTRESRDAALSTIKSLNANLSDANAREANHVCEPESVLVRDLRASLAAIVTENTALISEKEELRRQISDHACIRFSPNKHSCPPPLGNPTREEAIEALKEIRQTTERALREDIAGWYRIAFGSVKFVADKVLG